MGQSTWGVVCKPSEDTVQVPLAKWQGLLHQLPFLLAPHSLLLSSKEILAMGGSCRSRDSMLEPESLDQLSPRRVVEITRGSDSTVTLGTMARPTLSNTPLESMDSELSEVKSRNMTMSTMMIPSQHLLLSTLMILLINRETFLMEESSPPLPPFLSAWKPHQDQTDSSLLVRSS